MDAYLPHDPTEQLWLGLLLGRLELVEQGIAEGADIKTPCGGRKIHHPLWQEKHFYHDETPLHAAFRPSLPVRTSRGKTLKTAKYVSAAYALLLDHGADPNQAIGGNTALLTALKTRRITGLALQRMAQAGADSLDYADAHGSNTALHVACQQGDGPMVKSLVKLGVKLEARNKAGETPLASAIRELVNKHQEDPTKFRQICRYLLKHGAQAGTLDDFGNSLLMSFPRLPLKEWARFGVDPAYTRPDGWNYLAVLLTGVEKRKDYAFDCLVDLMPFPGIDWLNARSAQGHTAQEVVEDALASFPHTEQGAELGRFIRAQFEGNALQTATPRAERVGRMRL